MSSRDMNALPRARARYGHWTRVSIRFCDQDPLGHVNNAAVATYVEQARVALIYPLMDKLGAAHLQLVIARLTIDYLRELGFPGIIEIGTRIGRLGAKSFTLQHGLFMEGEDECVATAECIMVFFDLGSRATALPPPELRAAMEAFVKAQPA